MTAGAYLNANNKRCTFRSEANNSGVKMNSLENISLQSRLPLIAPILLPTILSPPLLHLPLLRDALDYLVHHDFTI